MMLIHASNQYLDSLSNLQNTDYMIAGLLIYTEKVLNGHWF